MLIKLLKKELKVFFTNKGNLIFMTVLPIAMVLIMSVCLENYMDSNYGTFDDVTIFYYKDNPSAEIEKQFLSLSEKINTATGAEFEEVSDYENAKKGVDKSKGVGIVTLNGTQLSYYHSPYNETNGGKIIRNLFENFIASPSAQTNYITPIKLDVKAINAKVYYSFSALSFVLLYMALLVANSTADEKEFKTLDRIRISKAGLGNMFASKIIVGMICGIGIIAIVKIFVYFALDVTWGPMTYLIIALLLLLSLFSAVFGSVLGLICKTKTQCQDIILILNILFGFLGGSFLPLTALENIPIINWIIKASPLYWINLAMASLYNETIDRNTYYSVMVLIALSIIILFLYFKSTKKNHKEGVEC